MAIRIHHAIQNNKHLIRDYADANDEDLMILSQHGDGKAFDVLMSRHTGLVWKLVKQYMGSLQDVDDIYQDICLTVWQKKLSWKPDVAKFSTWLYRIVTNRCIDLIRARKPHDNSESVFDDLESDIPRADEVILSKEIAAALQSCLAELPIQQQRALKMMYYQDSSISNICDEMTLSEDAVRSLLKRGKQKLRQIIPTETQCLTA